MRMIGLWAAVALVLAWQTTAYGQGAPLKAASTPAPIPLIQQSTASKDLAEVAVRLSAIDSAIAKLTEKAGKTDYMPALLGVFGGLFGVLIGGIITFITQRRHLANQWAQMEATAKHNKELADAKAEQERTLAENRAKIEIGNSFIQWQLKQLSELYGPLHALLRQSNAMYRHMNTVLAKMAPERFRLQQGSPGDDFDNKVFEIKMSEHWVRFRTIMHIREVYGRNYGIEDYFNEVVAIGGRIVKVIEEKAGYARPEQAELVSIFGKYLAHYSVLNRLHFHMQPKPKASSDGDKTLVQAHDASAPAIIVDESAVFPTEIQGLVDAGFNAINNDLNAWQAKAAA